MENNQCIKCDKCLPCATGIHISKVITFIDRLNSIDKNDISKIKELLNDTELSREMKIAENCRRCYKCNRICPKKIDVPLEITFNLSEYKKLKLSFRDNL